MSYTFGKRNAMTVTYNTNKRICWWSTRKTVVKLIVQTNCFCFFYFTHKRIFIRISGWKWVKSWEYTQGGVWQILISNSQFVTKMPENCCINVRSNFSSQCALKSQKGYFYVNYLTSAKWHYSYKKRAILKSFENR